MIGVVIPAYKNPEQLEKCIAHLKVQDVEMDIFVRDNSVDNVYFTRSVNEGLRRFLDSGREYILVLNQDMYLEAGCVEAMGAFMDSHPRCGIGTALQLSDEDRGYCICGGTLDAFPLGRHQHGPVEQFGHDSKIYWANGACMILRSEMVRRIGLMDENFVFIGSDSDYSFTARSRGWEVWRIGGARGVHQHGASGDSGDEKIELLKAKDMLYFGEKWITGGVYRTLAFEGKNCTPENVEDMMAQLLRLRRELEESIGSDL